MKKQLSTFFVAVVAMVFVVGIDAFAQPSTSAYGTGFTDTLIGLYSDIEGTSFGSGINGETFGEDPIVQEHAVSYYVRKYGVSMAEAKRRIEIQDVASGIEDDIEALLGSRFAGVWYDANRGGRLQIGVVPSARTEVTSIKRIIDQYRVATITDVVDVRFSIAELRQTQRLASAEITELMRAGTARIGYNPKMNGVRVSIVRNLTAAERAKIDRVGAMPGVYFRIAKASSLKMKFDQCAVRKCDPPMRGGRGIVRNGYCTSAFVATFNDNPSIRGITTAGHCVFLDGQIDGVWASRNQANTLHNIGPARKYYFAGSVGEDEAMIRIDGNGYWGSPQAVGKVVVKGSDDTTYNPNYHIHNDSTSSIGQILCMTGRTTGTHCGEVDDLGEEVTGELNGVDYTVRDMGELDSCEAEGGDSGGPLYKNNKAFGIFSGSGMEDFLDCDEFYQGIRKAQQTLNVRLVFVP